MKTWAIRIALASVLIVAVQVAAVSNYRIAGITVMIVWLWPVIVGLLGASLPGIVAGAVSGFLFDTHVATPFGLFTITGMVLGWAAGQLGREGIGDFDAAAWWMPTLIGAGFGFLGPVVLVVFSFLVGDAHLWRGDVGATMVINGIAFAILVRPAARLARVLTGDLEGFRW